MRTGHRRISGRFRNFKILSYLGNLFSKPLKRQNNVLEHLNLSCNQLGFVAAENIAGALKVFFFWFQNSQIWKIIIDVKFFWQHSPKIKKVLK